MAVRLSDLSVGRPLPPGRFLVLISIRGCINPRAIMRLERLGKLKNQMTSSEIEPATFYAVPQAYNYHLKLGYGLFSFIAFHGIKSISDIYSTAVYS
jgi:hypothetical protein